MVIPQVGHAAYACHKSQSDGSSLQNLVPVKNIRYIEGHSRELHIEEFWETHERFGFVKTDDGRILLIGKDAVELNQILEDLRIAANSKLALPKPTKNTPVKEGASFDVTKFIDPMMQTILDFQTKSNGPNCFNLCLVRTKVTAYFRPTTMQEFAYWLRGPLSEEIKSTDQLKPGDVLAFWDSQDGFLHGAIYISKNLVISKNGASSGFGYRIQDLREVANDYAGPNHTFQSQVKAYRLKDWRILLNQLSPKSRENLMFFWDEAESFEKLAHDFYTFASKEKRLETADKIDQYIDETLSMVQYKLASLGKFKDPTPEEKTLKFLWKGLELKIQSLKLFRIQSSKIH